MPTLGLDRKRLWDDLVEEGKIAQTQLHNITAAIMSELRQDASEASDFEQLLRDNGEQVGGGRAGGAGGLEGWRAGRVECWRAGGLEGGGGLAGWRSEGVGGGGD